MAGESLVLSIDCGTQSSRAVIWDSKGIEVSEGRRDIKIYNPCPGWYEEEAADWWSATCFAVRQAIQSVDTRRLAAMAITHQRESFVPVASDGTPLRRALLFMDSRCAEQVEYVAKRIGAEKILRIAGKMPCNVPSLYDILWLRDREPETFNKTFKFLDVQAYLLHHLVGGYRTSYVSADPFSLINIRTRDWDKGLMNRLGLERRLFPDLCAPGEIIGEVTDGASRETGLPAGLPVVACGGDGNCAALGTNVVQEGRAFLYIGTAAVLGAYSADYIVDHGFRTLCSCIPGAYNLEAGIIGGYIVSWFKDSFPPFSAANDKRTPEKILEGEALNVPAGSDGLITVPYWGLGALAPYWDPWARGLTVGWTGSHGRPHFYRSILEGIAFEFKLLLGKMADALGVEFKDLILTGGGAKSDLWGQIISDVIGIPVYLSRTIETTALGAAIVAAAGTGIYPSIEEAARNMTAAERRYIPNGKTSKLYDLLFENVYRHLFPTLQTLINRLAQISANPTKEEE